MNPSVGVWRTLGADSVLHLTEPQAWVAVEKWRVFERREKGGGRRQMMAHGLAAISERNGRAFLK